MENLNILVFIYVNISKHCERTTGIRIELPVSMKTKHFFLVTE